MGKSLIERLKEKQENIRKNSQGSPYHLIPEGTTRFRILPVGDDQDWSLEVVYFYPNKDIGGFISPVQWGKKCAFMEAYEKLKQSEDPKDNEFAKKIKPKKKFLVPAIKYTDATGTTIDESAGVRLVLLSQSAVTQLIDLFVDEKDNGDFTHPLTGYDVKIKRTGKGQYDTEYSVIAGKPSKLAKAYRGIVNIEEMAKAITPTYEETKQRLESFMGVTDSGDDETPAPPKKKKKKISRDL